MGALALDATTAATLQFFGTFLTRGARVFFIGRSRFVQAAGSIVVYFNTLLNDGRIVVEWCDECRQPRTIFSQWKVFLLPSAGYHLGRVKPQNVAPKLNFFFRIHEGGQYISGRNIFGEKTSEIC